MQHDKFCDGDHDDDEDCTVKDECDPRCGGHSGQDTDCVICPEPRCLAHPDDNPNRHDDVCTTLNCKGHEWDGSTMWCDDGHVAWCDGSNNCFGGIGGTCNVRLGLGVELTTRHEGGTSMLTGMDVASTGDFPALYVILETAHTMLAGQEQWAAAFAGDMNRLGVKVS